MNQTGAALQEDMSEAQLDRAIEELRGALGDQHKARPEAQPASARSATAAEIAAPNAGIIMNIPVDVQIVLGSAEMPVSELMTLQKGSTVSLNRRIGEPVDVVVNGRRIARGEIIVLESDPSRFGIRLSEIITSAKPA